MEVFKHQRIFLNMSCFCESYPKSRNDRAIIIKTVLNDLV